jgi:diguanylate cyclase (GGDEF)-like protein
VVESDRTDGAVAGRRAAALFGLTGLLVLAGLAAPGRGSVSGILAVGGAALATAIVVYLLPWRRWPVAATLGLVPVAFLLVGFAKWEDVIPVRAYGVEFVLVYAWVGLHHRPGVGLRLLPLAAVAYAGPLILFEADPPLDPRALLLALAVCVLVGETTAYGQAEARASADRAHRAVAALRTMTKSGGSVGAASPDDVLEAVADATEELGYDGVSLAIPDPGAATFTPRQVRGIAVPLGGQSFPVEGGVTGSVLATGEVVVAKDYARWRGAFRDIAGGHAGTVIGVPVVSGDQLVGVLNACTSMPFTPAEQDIDVLQALAEVAGTALRFTRELDAAASTAAAQAAAARTDALTGVFNRREGDRLLAVTTPGDVLALVDVDEFSEVNARLGHAGGDQVLTALADHLGRRLRAGDTVVRHGGDEFLLVLPSCEPDEAATVLGRLQASWSASDPDATFSVGFARHRAGRTPAETLHRADQALYAAKDAGRDQVAAAMPELVGP